MTKDTSSETVSAVLSTNILTTTPSNSIGDLLANIANKSWDDIQYAYVLDAQHKLLGIVNLAKATKINTTQPIEEIMTKPEATLTPNSDQEKAVLLAVQHNITAIAVVDKEGRFLGAIPANQLITIMHQEHLEDALLTSGMRGRGSHILKLATARYRVVISARIPWLIFGAVVGLGLGLISSFFEKTLAANVALAYFLPVVAYIADSVGTQSEAITVRALATIKINFLRYMTRELFVGLALGVLLGAMGFVGALLISQSPKIGIVVGLALFAASTVAAVLASLIPIIFKMLGKDPALGSGPFSTALQDVISVLVYFAFAIYLL